MESFQSDNYVYVNARNEGRSLTIILTKLRYHSFNICLLNNLLILKIPCQKGEYFNTFSNFLLKIFFFVENIFTHNLINVEAATVLR